MDSSDVAMRVLMSALVILAVAGGSFALGLHSAIKRTFIFDGVVFVAEGAMAVLGLDDEDEAALVQLDFSDRALLDTNRLPFRQSEIRLSTAEGRQQQLVAVVRKSDRTALVLSEKGFLFDLIPGECTSEDCMVPSGRLVRADGSALDDIYDLLAVPGEEGPEFYVSFGQERPSDNTKAFYLSRVRIPAVSPPDGVYSVKEVIFESASFTLDNGHAAVGGGGGLAYDPSEHRIIMTIGDFGLNGFANDYVGDIPPPQDPESDLGKVHAIDLATGDSEMLSIGHRNPQGLTITRAGEIISTEHAAKGGDEVNIITPGENYGWPYVSLGTMYEQYTFPEVPLDASLPHGGYRTPLSAFVPSIGISALMEVQDLHDAWDGDLLIGSLKAQSLFRLRRWEGGSYIEQVHLGDRVRDLEIVDGVLLLSSDAGKLHMLTPVEDIENLRTGIGLVTNKNALASCGQCHSLSSPRSSDFAPHLVNVYTRPVASLADYGGYSEALIARKDEVWTQDNLKAFLADPQGFAPGSTMPAVELTDAEMAEILDGLPLLR